MSDLFKDLMDKAKETLDPIVDKAKEAVESGELKDKAGDILESVKAKAGELKDAAASGELKDKAGDIMDKAAPIIDKVKDVAGDVLDKVKDGVNEAMTGEKPPLDVKNDLFSKLGEEVAGNREAIQEQAAKMEEKIKEMLDGKEE